MMLTITLNLMELILLGLGGAGVGAGIVAWTKQTKHERKVEHMSEAIDQLKQEITNLIAQVDNQSGQITNLNTLIVKVGTETDGLKETIAKLEEAIQNGADVAEVTALVGTLRSKIETQSGLLATAQTSAQAVDEKVADAPATEEPTPENPENPPANP